MDRLRNPYTPNAGARPPNLAGRDELIADFDLLLDRVAAGYTEKGYLITGLRGVGKTVLLAEFEDLARSRHMVVITHEVAKAHASFSQRFASLARRALLEVSPAERWKERGHRAAAVLSMFKGQFDSNGRWTISFDPDKAGDVSGTADTGDVILDLPDVMEALGEAAREHFKTIVFLLDEIQFLSQDELSALVMAKQRINAKSLPILLAGAGLPQLPSLAAVAQTYAERMFKWPQIGRLSGDAAREALTSPAAAEGVQFTDDALDYIVDYTEGYPFFIQEFGKAVWDVAEQSPITLDDALVATTTVEAILDQDFFSLRVAGLPEGELNYIAALASLGPGEHAPAEIAAAMGKTKSSQIAATGKRLTERGLLYSTRRGQVAFTVPQFDRYVLRSQQS